MLKVCACDLPEVTTTLMIIIRFYSSLNNLYNNLVSKLNEYYKYLCLTEHCIDNCFPRILFNIVFFNNDGLL